jgi:hypothetical protein
MIDALDGLSPHLSVSHGVSTQDTARAALQQVAARGTSKPS